MSNFSKNKGFSLVELMIVVVVMVILMVATIIFYFNINKRARDAVRMADLANIQQAILLSGHEGENNNPGEESSFPLSETTRNTDGSGWVKLNFDSKNSANFHKLPLDPLNTQSYHYSYSSNGKTWILEAILESSEYSHYMKDDGGVDPNKYEISNKLKTLTQ